MQTYNQTLQAGQRVQWNIEGVKFQVLQGSQLIVELQKNFTTAYTATNVSAGMWSQPDGGFSCVAITNTTANPMAITFFVTNGDAGYDQPVATLTVSGLTQSQIVLDQVITNDAGEVIGTSVAQIVPQDLTRRGLRLLSPKTNSGLIYLGGANVSASSPMYLNPGDYYDETQCPDAAWYAVASQAGQALNVMEIH